MPVFCQLLLIFIHGRDLPGLGPKAREGIRERRNERSVFRKTCGISWLADEILAFQERLCFGFYDLVF
jgi:hypothetical protein